MIQIGGGKIAQGFQGAADQSVGIERAGIAGGLVDGLLDALTLALALLFGTHLAQSLQLPGAGIRHWRAGCINAVAGQYALFLLP